MTVVDIEKSTFGMIHMLMDNHKWLAAITILTCSVVAPFVKLAVLLVCAYLSWGRDSLTPEVCTAITAVRRISKWATIDAFTATMILGCFCANDVIEVHLHSGFYCFLGYCIFSIAGALLLDTSDGEAAEEQLRLVRSNPSRDWQVPVMVCSIVVLGILNAMAVAPLFTVQVSILSLEEKMSFVSLVRNLAGPNGSHVALLAFVTLGALVPAADFLGVIAEVFLGRTEHPIREWLQDFAMLDVLALTLVVMSNAASGVHDSLSVTLLPAGWILFTMAITWVVYSLTLRSKPVATMQVPKIRITPPSPTAPHQV